MEELRDIQGLDQITAWPLAFGWWVILLLSLVAMFFLGRYLYNWYAYRTSWRFRSYKTLSELERSLPDEEPKSVVEQLSIELKRIAMATLTRESCAGLAGKRWLEWLHDNDPNKFLWQQHGNLLIEVQYSPALVNCDRAQVSDLIKAAKAWVEKC